MTLTLLVLSLLGLTPAADDLPASGILACETKRPIVLYVSRSDCTFCRLFEQDQLKPLLRSGDYRRRAIFLELIWDAPISIIGFDGVRQSPEAFARARSATLTPTVLFVDAQGNEIVERITGYRPNDYYGYYFERSILAAHDAMQTRLCQE